MDGPGFTTRPSGLTPRVRQPLRWSPRPWAPAIAAPRPGTEHYYVRW